MSRVLYDPISVYIDNMIRKALPGEEILARVAAALNDLLFVREGGFFGGSIGQVKDAIKMKLDCSLVVAQQLGVGLSGANTSACEL